MTARKRTWPLIFAFLLVAGIAAAASWFFYEDAPPPPAAPRAAHASTPKPRATSRVPQVPPRPRAITGALVQPITGAREPSGALALPGKGIVLVVDDEPKRAPRQLGLFAYQVSGKRLRHLPLALKTPQARDWDDWEGIATDGHYVVLMTSHSNRKGKRARFCRFPRSALQVSATKVVIGAALECVGGKKQRKRIKKLLKRARKHLGFSLPQGWRKRRAKAGGLDMEAIVYATDTKQFMIGLRGPLATRGGRKYAILLAMRWTQGKPQLQVAGLLDVEGRGIRAMAQLPKGGIIISAGPVGNKGSFRLFQLPKWPPLPFPLLQPKPLRTLPSTLQGHRLRVEGIAAFGKWSFLFSDSGDWYAAKAAHVLVLPSQQVSQP